MSFASGSALPPPDFEVASVFPEAAWLRQAAAARDWASIRQYVDGLPREVSRSFAVGVLDAVPGIEGWMREILAATPDDVLALTVLGAREVVIGWEIRTSASAKDVSREQFAGLHAHLRQAEQRLIRATALDPSSDAAWAERLTTAKGLELGQNEARRRYDRLAAHHPHHFNGQGRLLQQLCPKWGGSWEAAHGFARECLLNSPEGAVNGAMVAEVHMEHRLALRGQERDAYLRQAHVHAELAEAAERSVLHPHFRRDYGWVIAQSAFAAMFSLVGDLARAAACFRALGPFASKYPWSYLGDPAAAFVKHRDAALAKG
ncbi:hypothetical protein OIB37_16005 [Streptomyces sp. NBC_00820]|uniref:hypothetical protein n=1 Tax=Streptomyces sp. NBC_00820 TaxID=2975842 RepID=UPI002ECFC462|nr:hypothetical protein OIB37_16005 [Streptomyces sp. NBC_00820]